MLRGKICFLITNIYMTGKKKKKHLPAEIKDQVLEEKDDKMLLFLAVSETN